jgi:TolA-binding protein
MMLDEPTPTTDPSVAKLAALAHQRLGVMSDVQEARGLHGVQASFRRAMGAPPRSRRFVWVGATAVCALLLAGLTIGHALLRQRPLTFSVIDGEIQTGGYFRAGPKSQPRLQFSDGTKLDLMAGTRGRIASIDAHGARVMLDEGETRVEVTSGPETRWLFEAGPFVVHVHGTAFTLAWKGDEGRLDVRLNRGAISVTGPLSEQAIALRPGQWLTVRLAAHEVFVRDFDRTAPPSLASTATAPPATPPAPASDPAGPAPAPALIEPARVAPQAHRVLPRSAAPATNLGLSWDSARAAGDWERILELASQRGLEQTLAERSSEDLALLADAAHYLHHDDIAQKSLLAQRRRFAGSTRAKDAAFLLGRIVEARAGGASEALDWYDRHLEEAPGGAYESEALGRKMTVLARLRGNEAARPVAEEYLRRYPGGTYARAARAYVSRP